MPAYNPDLPAFTGNNKSCPKCRSYVKNQYHWAGGCWAPKKTHGQESPCKDRRDLQAIGEQQGEHLCRVCPSCGFGWVEACSDRDGPPEDEPAEGAAVTAGVLVALPGDGDG